jgi:hypothetical protein
MFRNKSQQLFRRSIRGTWRRTLSLLKVRGLQPGLSKNNETFTTRERPSTFNERPSEQIKWNTPERRRWRKTSGTYEATGNISILFEYKLVDHRVVRRRKYDTTRWHATFINVSAERRKNEKKKIVLLALKTIEKMSLSSSITSLCLGFINSVHDAMFHFILAFRPM